VEDRGLNYASEDFNFFSSKYGSLSLFCCKTINESGKEKCQRYLQLITTRLDLFVQNWTF
jgi:hypothetical protein